MRKRRAKENIQKYQYKSNHQENYISYYQNSGKTSKENRKHGEKHHNYNVINYTYVCISIYPTELRPNISVISTYLNKINCLLKKKPFKNWLAKKNPTNTMCKLIHETGDSERLKINSVGEAIPCIFHTLCTVLIFKFSSDFRHCCGYWFQVDFAIV